ncbi:hypothetical protein [Bacillus suaedae]|uniref:Uncharacterized protein n=1 Tax=Halalkalibacter suaedae TaxID=2822140 RepID=A0A941AM80_9BACI|nr:hypothetical protein [Bacillus suaedae]MBP3950215.1 hypothetical protein [Bacillus suaedae]
MSSLFHFFLLFLSLGGWGVAISYKLKINNAFIPIFLYSAITFVLFIAGVLNILPLIVTIIFYVGLLVWPVFIYFLLKERRKPNLSVLLSPALIFFVIATTMLMFLVKGVSFTHYDNFSHWALIVKEMYLMDGLPDDSTVISFRNYPPGTALFIYFVLKITGYAESYALMAQNFLLAASLTVLFAYTSWKKPLYILLTLLLVIGLLSLELYSIYNLIVDKTLGMVAFTSVIISYYYRDDWKKILLTNVPILVLLILIKDSGKLFFILNALLIIGLLFSNIMAGSRFNFKNVTLLGKITLILIGVPTSINYLWGQYTAKAYTADYASNKFALTESKLSSSDKSEEFVQTLLPKMFNSLVNFDDHNFLILVVTNATLIISFIALWIVNKKASKLLVYAFLFCNITFIIYLGSLYLMYLFLMPEHEATRLASYSRYLTTIVIYIGAVGIGATLLVWSKLPTRSLKMMLAVLLVALICYPTYEKVEAGKGKPDINESIRSKVKPAVAKIKNQDKGDPRILYYSPESQKDGGYLSYIALFEQLSRNYKIIRGCEEMEQAELEKAQYLVVLNRDNGECLPSDLEEGIYKVSKKDQDIMLEPF